MSTPADDIEIAGGFVTELVEDLKGLSPTEQRTKLRKAARIYRQAAHIIDTMLEEKPAITMH